MESLPRAFIDSLQGHFSNEVITRVVDAMSGLPTTSVRLNTAKPSNRFEAEKSVPWSPNGKLLSERPAFVHDPLFHAGAYYVQDSSSMIMEHVLDQLQFDMEGVLALDLCASPGGKSIILSDYLGDKGFLLANEIDQKRNAVLSENLLKWGSAHHAVSQLSASKLGEMKNIFDLVLIDAPCSGEGMFRKDAFAIEQWNLDLVEQCATVQSTILANIDPAIRPGGYVVYSTCTMNIRENEERVLRMLDMGYELVSVEMSRFEDKLVPATNGAQTLGWYLLPGVSTGEGLFVSVLRKKHGVEQIDTDDGLQLSEFQSTLNIPQDTFSHQWSKKEVHYGVLDRFALLNRLPRNMAFKSVGLPAYELKGDMHIPQHGLAMLRNQVVDIELNLEQALHYLRGETLRINVNSDKAWCLIGYEGIPLGWVKVVPDRLNNHYPKPYRLRK